MKIAVIGATGFTGEKLVELLIGHNKVEVTYLTSRTPVPVPYKDMFPKFNKRIDICCEKFNFSKAIKKADFFFLSLPHTVSMEFSPRLIKAGKKVVDLSADYRLKDPLEYKKFYKTAHKDKAGLKSAVYGMPEFFKGKIKKACLIANPGCYPTSVILALAPLAKLKLISQEVFVDSKSSITGAGRKAAIEYHYSNIADNVWGYKPFTHQHVPEMISQIKSIAKTKLEINFVPHVVGVAAGIYSTIYVKFNKKITKSGITKIYKDCYNDSPFVRVLSKLPKLSEVRGTNFCDIGFEVADNGKSVVIMSAIDNLIKGAAGTAVQNMNIMSGYEQTEGLL